MDWNFYEPSPEDDQYEPKRPVIALMGTMGVGKTCFVSQATGQDLETQNPLDAIPQISEHNFWLNRLNMDIKLIDTPGFDDPNKSDHVLLGEFSEYLQDLSSQGLSLWGIIYFHRINDTRMYGSAQRTLRLLTMMIGDRGLKSLRLCTTMWDQVDRNVGESREKQLKSKYWTEWIDKGAHLERFDGTPKSAHTIIEKLVRSVVSLDSIHDHHAMDQPNDRRPLSETEEGRQALQSIDTTLQDLQEQQQDIQSQLENSYGGHSDGIELSTRARVVEGQIRVVEGLRQSFLNPGSHGSNSPDPDEFNRLSIDPDSEHPPFTHDPRASWDGSIDSPPQDSRKPRMQRSFGGKGFNESRRPEIPSINQPLESPHLDSEDYTEGRGLYQMPNRPRNLDRDFPRKGKWS